MTGGRFLAALGAAATAAASGPAAAAAPPTLCRADEQVVFSCSTGAHIASICASKNLSPTSGYLQYRFGKGSSLDLAWPDLTARPSQVFTAGMMMYSGGGGAWLRFGKGAFAYTIFSAIGKWGPGESVASVSGVAVEKDGGPFANFPCRGAMIADELGPDLFDKAGLKTTDSADAFEIPPAFMPK